MLRKKIISSLKQGTLVYIVGHLGSGKIQIAREAAIEFTLGNIIQKELEENLENWFLKILMLMNKRLSKNLKN